MQKQTGAARAPTYSWRQQINKVSLVWNRLCVNLPKRNPSGSTGVKLAERWWSVFKHVSEKVFTEIALTPWNNMLLCRERTSPHPAHLHQWPLRFWELDYLDNKAILPHSIVSTQRVRTYVGVYTSREIWMLRHQSETLPGSALMYKEISCRRVMNMRSSGLTGYWSLWHYSIIHRLHNLPWLITVEE